MKKGVFITKGISYLILVIILYMHVCSAMCATGTRSCCEIEDNDCDDCIKDCCQHKENSEKKEHDCQDTHLSFFSTTGQYAKVKVDLSFNPTQQVVEVFTFLYAFAPIEKAKNIFAYTGFHPPPPKEDTRILIQSFQI
ncbi:MAG: hypothetical protein ABI763_13570 [Bacteroidota bacterium]